jgi:hypothetical protein
VKTKLIACNIFQREVCACLARTTRIVDVEFLDLGEHLRPDGLRQLLQARIDDLSWTSPRTFHSWDILSDKSDGSDLSDLRNGSVPLQSG